LLHQALTHTRGWCANSRIARVRLAAELERAQTEIAQLREEIRIKDARMSLIEPRHRPHYPAAERLAILELRAARGWSLTQTAKTLLVMPATVAEWMARLDEEGPHALVQLRVPVNKYPQFVAYLVQRLKELCPTLGKAKIARHLARAGLHLAGTTVGRMLRPPLNRPPNVTSASSVADTGRADRAVTAKRPNHVWHVDLTVVPIVTGFWVPWLPFAFLQRWPFCWWVLAVIDHFSRRVVALGLFRQQPTAQQVCIVLDRTIRAAGQAPKYTVSDKGPQFFCSRFKSWCERRKIRPRFGAVGKCGSIAVVERFIKSLKTECIRALPLVPAGCQAMAAELSLYAAWFNAHRPHVALGGRTPNEVYFRRKPANTKPRHEPRPCWPRASPCANPQAPVRGHCGARAELTLAFIADRRHLPLIRLKRTA
jgi:putative transposase